MLSRNFMLTIICIMVQTVLDSLVV